MTLPQRLEWSAAGCHGLPQRLESWSLCPQRLEWSSGGADSIVLVGSGSNSKDIVFPCLKSTAATASSCNNNSVKRPQPQISMMIS